MSITAPTRQTLRHLRRLCVYSSLVEPVGGATPQTHHIRTSSYTLPHLVSHPSRQHTRTISVSSGRHHGSQQATATASSDKPDSTTTTTAPLPDISTYYTLFPNTLSAGPPPTGPFNIPLAQLKREFLLLQSQHHPDKYTSQPTAHQKAMALSSLLNSAYKTLSDPLLRARYLLHHTYGIDITSEDNSTHSGLTDQETLMEVMEAQEAIEEAETQEQVDALKEENQARIDQTIKLLGQAFEHEDVEAAKTECIRLNYWRSLQQGLHEWEPGKEVRLIH
ncbi:Fe-S protein assembly co-chaperone HscB [Exophiala oligosperma]|uniref:Fe-S protein assembly co-chaperone HscB n=1 Tax=Exophiala oligosperma TaxID=215243 RepID=A0A0D2EDX5_9EURO|nr:Fe-S protein assembly co-chaperone HscB [Exophiala oligosperma]KIW46134.1 Fe-S protein assembly co-chaperone HscB [Exophiala oligosperma]